MEPRDALFYSHFIGSYPQVLGKSLFLSIISIAGVITTAVLAAKETPKAMKKINELGDDGEDVNVKDKIFAAAPVYTPAIVSGVLTCGCIFSIGILSKKNQVMLTSSYALLNNNYKKYVHKLKELYGEEAHRNIETAIAVEEAKAVPIYAPSIYSNSTLGIDFSNEEPCIFYDGYSERYFESTIGRVLQAEYHINRNFALGGDVTLNDFYDFLGIAKIEGGDNIGWSCMGGYGWIDFDNYSSTLDDGTKCIVISPVFMPDCFEGMEE